MGGSTSHLVVLTGSEPPGPPPGIGMVWVPAGKLVRRSDDCRTTIPAAARVRVGGFWMDRHPVTNRDFAVFVRRTGYLTVVERMPELLDRGETRPEVFLPGSAVWGLPSEQADLATSRSWWRRVPGASWRAPAGPGSSAVPDHPVVHVTWEDVTAYAQWAGKEIPTEPEWEYAALGGLPADEAGGGEPSRAAALAFDEIRDQGGAGLTAVAAFPPNPLGLCGMVGNVWEWTADWYGGPLGAASCPWCPCVAPWGGHPVSGVALRAVGRGVPYRVIKGGSYLCALCSWQRGRRCPHRGLDARLPQAVDVATSHLGFRCVVRVSVSRERSA